MKRRRRKRLAMRASRDCLSGRKCFRAGRVIGMAASSVTLRRSVRADGQVHKVVGKMRVKLQTDLLTEKVSNSIDACLALRLTGLCTRHCPDGFANTLSTERTRSAPKEHDDHRGNARALHSWFGHIICIRSDSIWYGAVSKSSSCRGVVSTTLSSGIWSQVASGLDVAWSQVASLVSSGILISQVASGLDKIDDDFTSLRHVGGDLAPQRIRPASRFL